MANLFRTAKVIQSPRVYQNSNQGKTYLVLRKRHLRVLSLRRSIIQRPRLGLRLPQSADPAFLDDPPRPPPTAQDADNRPNPGADRPDKPGQQGEAERFQGVDRGDGGVVGGEAPHQLRLQDSAHLRRQEDHRGVRDVPRTFLESGHSHHVRWRRVRLQHRRTQLLVEIRGMRVSYFGSALHWP
jgi:hypothetical protein